MSTATGSPDFFEPSTTSSQPDLLVSAALPQLSPVLQGTCSQLAEQWASHIDQAPPATRALSVGQL